MLKTLKELEDDGIMTVRKSTLDHTTKGVFTKLKNPNKPISLKNGGTPDKGFHSESSFAVLNANGTPGKVTETLPNGVRIGNIELHKDKTKSESNGQTWFPKDWTDDDILEAATAVLNKPLSVNNLKYTGDYKLHKKTVRIIVYTNNPGTIYPDKNNQPI